MEIDYPTFQFGLILFPRDTVHSRSGFPLPGVKAFPKEPDCQMVEQAVNCIPFLSLAAWRTPANPWDTRASLCVECVLD